MFTQVLLNKTTIHEVTTMCQALYLELWIHNLI